MTQLDRLARWVLDSETTALQRWAEEHTAKRRRVNAKSAPRRKAARASKAQRRENLATTRAAIWARSGGVCEVCRTLDGSHLHHLHFGRGKRRKYEGPNATAWLCVLCHQQNHDNRPEVLQRLADLAVRIDAPFEVQAALGRRLAKARRGGAA